jgi:AraC family transcriptional regulator
MNLIHPPGYLYGKCLWNSKIPDFRLAESEYQRGLRTPYHAHEHALLCFVLEGAYTNTCRMEPRTYRPSTVFFLPPGEGHLSDFSNTDVRIFRVEIDPQRLRHIGEYSVVPDCPFEFDGGNLPRLAIRLYAEFKRMDETSPLAIEGLILEMIAETSRGSTRNNQRSTPRWLHQARELLRHRFTEKLSLAEIARPVGVHPVYLANEFRRHYCSTIGEYVRQLRIEYACRQLSASDVSITEIAVQAGFADHSHFCRVFKRFTGMTPKRYRASVC